MKQYNYLHGTDIYLYQDSEMFRTNTDTNLLGHYYKLKNNETILDIGTNNGALLLYKKGINAHFYGIDINDKALELAKENFALNNMDVTLINMDVKDYKNKIFDVIVCNPPYFRNNNRNENIYLANARHSDSLELDALFKAMRSLIKENGRIYMVHRADYLTLIIEEALKNGLKVKEIEFAYDINKDFAKTILIEFRVGDNTIINIKKPIMIER